jgi:hypothetical protein
MRRGLLVSLAGKDGRKVKLARAAALSPISDQYDIIFIDCPRPTGYRPLKLKFLRRHQSLYEFLRQSRSRFYMPTLDRQPAKAGPSRPCYGKYQAAPLSTSSSIHPRQDATAE